LPGLTGLAPPDSAGLRAIVRDPPTSLGGTQETGSAGVIILFFVVWGMAIGWIAGMILGHRGSKEWGLYLFAGLAGSFVGGFLSSLLFGDGTKFRPSGVIGSIIGAMVIIAVADWAKRRGHVRDVEARKGERSGNPAKQAEAQARRKRR
jgi:uncharacterized membrane protein YeaQ/YmgE (transglycosylase-associated protein family)